MMDFIVSALGGYILGSIPFGLVLCFMFGYGDIRAIGSGNIGATNVLRTGNKLLALATLILDSGKGAAAVLIAHYFFGGESAIIAGFLALIGHLYPVWLKFKGGKGVATTLGTLLALAPYVGLVACAIWLGMAAVFRYSSLAALTAVIATPIIAHLLYQDANLSGLCAAISVLIWIKHRANIKRLMAGEEPKIGQKK
ncbi:MAG: glycerol-3-phosphate 1-O-acyltransferase PlsY [Alphaproteobacteria bacterium]|nr:glycerol-3-phosphate 1-O-acyltransferase PlsY [Alphaproteobacteria bacterium]